MELTIKEDKKKIRTNRTIRMTDEEYNEAMNNAIVFCNGNFSRWIRYASKNCRPFKRDLVKK